MSTPSVPTLNFTVRRATERDAARLTAIWLEAAEALAQADPRLRLAQDAAEQHRAALEQWLTQAQRAVFVAVRLDGEVMGYIMGELMPNQPGFLPAQIGAVSDLAVDFHAKSGRIGRELFYALREWFKACGVDRILTHAPYRQPVAQAFWRAMGATKANDVFWMKV